MQGRHLSAAAAAGALVVALAGCGSEEPPRVDVPVLTQSSRPSASSTAPPPPGSSPAATRAPRLVGSVATGLAVPWGLDFLPSGEAVVTERDSRRVLLLDGHGGVREVGTIDEAAPQGEAGLLGVVVSPDFATDSTVFFYVTTGTDNRIVRATLRGGRLGTTSVVLDGIPAGFIHDGGRLEFGPDGYLYASTGETGDRWLAQDRESLAGKILRITAEGDPAPGNPFGTPVWSWGHRNVQGLAFDDAGRLWASEFGENTWDELNRIEPGANHGWPEVEGRGGGEGFTDPEAVWSTGAASPSGLAYAEGSLWMAGLRGNRLWRIPVVDGHAAEPADFFVGQLGRLRTVEVAPDGNLWVTTSNRDGRGEPVAADDRVIVVDPTP